MAIKTANAEGAQETTTRTRREKKTSPKMAVDEAISKIGETLIKEPVKATIGDFIKLLQLQKELQDEHAKEIKITWIEPMESVSEK